MAEITAKLIQELREKTSAGMMDCKKALTENNGDVQAAADWLRQKGIVKAASKAGRVAASGLVTVVKCDDMGCVVELNAETDFVAKNEKFQKLVSDVAARALELGGDFDATLAAVKDDIAATIATIGENMNLRRIAKVSGDHIYTYVHNALVPGMGQIGVIVAINGGDDAKVDEIGTKIAMHIAANKPEFMTIADVDPVAVEREKKVFIESGATANKPENVVEKMVQGRINKYYAESVLEEQPFVMDPSKTVKQVVAEAGGTLAGFAYYLLGEGIEKAEDNLADEVSKMLA
ncbi:MAG: translation elongation factor Ts [Alphaproteobacteria bacterium]|nr:translation elongation factor Ts [Alphaproteobacteria bacterium]MDE6571149.1 translation elongation factor Ts [Alphaproteobacteria bacterium]